MSHDADELLARMDDLIQAKRAQQRAHGFDATTNDELEAALRHLLAAAEVGHEPAIEALTELRTSIPGLGPILDRLREELKERWEANRIGVLDELSDLLDDAPVTDAERQLRSLAEWRRQAGVEAADESRENVALTTQHSESDRAPVTTPSPPQGHPAAPGCRLRLPNEAPAEREFEYDRGDPAIRWSARKLAAFRRRMQTPPEMTSSSGDDLDAVLRRSARAQRRWRR